MRRWLLCFVVLVTAFAAAGLGGDPGEYPPEGGSFEIDPTFVACGATVTGTGANWQPGSVVVFSIDGKTLGTTEAADDGSISATFELPDDIPLGDQIITAQGHDPSGDPQSIATAITIVECGSETAGVAVVRQESSGTLPYTGSDRTGIYVGIGVLLVLTGTVLVIAFSRRRRVRIEGS